jgi:pimeloyl-ACP methyl ester carboxylesterase
MPRPYSACRTRSVRIDHERFTCVWILTQNALRSVGKVPCKRTVSLCRSRVPYAYISLFFHKGQKVEMLLNGDVARAAERSPRHGAVHGTLFTQRKGWLRIYPDLPGTGRTPSADRLATHDAMLEAVLAFIDKVIPGQRFVLAGLSYGGYLARGVVYHRAVSIDGLMLCVPQVKADPAQAQLPPRTIIVEDQAIAAELGPIANLMVVQNPRVAEAVRELLAEAGPFSFDVDNLPTPFGGPTLIVTARQDDLCGYRDAWDLLDNYPRATFAVLDRAGHLVNIEQDALCQALMREWLDRVEDRV